MEQTFKSSKERDDTIMAVPTMQARKKGGNYREWLARKSVLNNEGENLGSGITGTECFPEGFGAIGSYIGRDVAGWTSTPLDAQSRDPECPRGEQASTQQSNYSRLWYLENILLFLTITLLPLFLCSP